MKKKTKLALGGLALALGAVILTGCTKSFCSVTDKAHILYQIDYGVTTYYDSASVPDNETVFDLTLADYPNITGIKYSIGLTDANALVKVNEAATKTNISVPSVLYWEQMDLIVLKEALDADPANKTKTNWTAADIRAPFERSSTESYTKGVLDKYGYLKFYWDSTIEGEKEGLWKNFERYDQQIRTSGKVSIDDCPTQDYLKLYKTTMQSNIAQYRSCLTTQTGDYGAYGTHKLPVEIEAKSWVSSIKKQGLFEFLLVWPIGAFIDVLNNHFLSNGIALGWSQLLAILVVTVVIRSIMLLATIKQTSSTAKMSALQPEITKIQNKYPNSNSNQYEKQRMAQEMQQLYKKNKINPLTSIILLIVQFPVFICVWGALQGSAALSTGSVLGLNLATSIREALFNKAAWASFTAGAPAALILFLLMSGTQVLSMLLPTIFQKAKAKKVAKMGRNPAQKQEKNKMQWFTYIMMAMIIIMGFSLVSGLGVYWLVGAIFSIVQTLMTELFNAGKAMTKRHPKGWKAYLEIYGRWWFKCKGTADRGEFWSAIGLYCALSLVPIVGWVAGLIGIPGIIGYIVRRLHDTGKSGLWALLLLTPFTAIALIVLLCLKTKEGNKFEKEN